jgi:hypothetical protein
MDANQAKADADRKTYQDMLAKTEAERKSDIENLNNIMERITNVNQAKTDAKHFAVVCRTVYAPLRRK